MALARRIYGRDFPPVNENQDVKAVCRRCHVVMRDHEPCTQDGEFFHPTKDKDGKPHWCKNAGHAFTAKNPEIEPFVRKGERRRNKRNGVRA